MIKSPAQTTRTENGAIGSKLDYKLVNITNTENSGGSLLQNEHGSNPFRNTIEVIEDEAH